MISSLYIGATGMVSLSEGLNVTAHNLANVSTIGYKQQDAQYSDLIYTTQEELGEWWENQEDSKVALNGPGHGVRLDDVRTIFTQGSLQSSNTLTDMAISGKGFFTVRDDENDLFYTRAGDFRTDADTVVRTPNGEALQGYTLADADTGEAVKDETLQDIRLNKFGHMNARATNAVKIREMNINPSESKTENVDNPYFSLLGLYNGTSEVPLSEQAYSYSRSMTMYDSEGNARTVTAYFDGVAEENNNGSKSVEFFLAAAPAEGTTYENNGDGALMSGILQFSSSGTLTGFAAYTPNESGNLDLSNWTAASLTEDGLPQFNLDGTTVSLDLGISAGEGWNNSEATASEVGINGQNLVAMNASEISPNALTAFSGSGSSMGAYDQNGCAYGVLSYYDISNDGTITGYYTNGDHMDLWQIPLARFTSEDGLRREGSNLFSYTTDAGAVEWGTAGTSNYGQIRPYNIEQSNVDMASEMVDLIVTQRGFQSNSKVITTSDRLLEVAINLKR